MLKTKNQIIILSFLSLLSVGLLDFYTHYEITLTLLYIVPVFLFSYQKPISQNYVILFSLSVGLLWFIIDYKTHQYSKELFLYWNSFSRIIIFLLFSIILKRIIIEKEQSQIISEQKGNLEEINKKLGIANADLNKYIGIAAHDIRNPVGNILGFSGLLLREKENPNLSQKQKSFLEIINDSAKNSLQILNDTLNISQIQSGTVILNKTKSDYIVFIKKCIELNNQLANGKKQNIQFNSSIDFIEIEFDSSRLQQVVNNLLTNAIKYSDFNKQIIVRVTDSENNKKYLLTEVIDEGLGISDEFKNSLFEPFTTTSNIPTNQESKTGLGLAIAKKIIEIHGGTINFISEKGKGSNFFFSLPIK